MAVQIDAITPETAPKKIIHEVRWLPSDPNDTSRYVAPIDHKLFQIVFRFVACSFISTFPFRWDIQPFSSSPLFMARVKRP